MFKFDPNSTIYQGRWRLRSPSEFSRMWTRHDVQARGISYIVGLLKTEGKFGIQSIRFDRTIWTEKKAAVWWKKNKSRFKKYWTEEDWKKRWKEPKKKKVGLTSAKRRKNPKLNDIPLNKSEISTFYDLLVAAIAYGFIRSFSALLNLIRIGLFCNTDCGEYFTKCTCEGSRLRSGHPCEQCLQNFCVCEYNLIIEDSHLSDYNNVTKEAWKLAKKMLNESQLEVLKLKIRKKLEYEPYNLQHLQRLLPDF